MIDKQIELKAVEGPFVEQTWDFHSPDLQGLLEIWRDLRGTRACPRWRDINLPSLYRQAPNILIKDAIDGGRDFRIRYWGTVITEWLHFDGTGKLISQFYPEAGRAAFLEAHRLALFGETPVRRWGVSVYPSRDYASFEAMDLPLENDAGERAHIMTMTVYSTLKGYVLADKGSQDK
jgi:hypothetical protein